MALKPMPNTGDFDARMKQMEICREAFETASFEYGCDNIEAQLLDNQQLIENKLQKALNQENNKNLIRDKKNHIRRHLDHPII